MFQEKGALYRKLYNAMKRNDLRLSFTLLTKGNLVVIVSNSKGNNTLLIHNLYLLDTNSKSIRYLSTYKILIKRLNKSALDLIRFAGRGFTFTTNLYLTCPICLCLISKFSYFIIINITLIKKE